MEAGCGNTSEHYNEKCVDNTVVSEIPNTAYSGTDTGSSYTHYVTHEHSSQVLTNSEMASYTTQEYSVETTLSYTENYSSDNVNNFNSNDDTKEMIENEIHEQPYETVQQVNIPMDTSDVSVSTENQNESNEFISEYPVEEIQAEKLVEELPEDKNIVIEEPVEGNEEIIENVEKTQQTSQEITVEEIEDSSLPGYETVDNLESDNIVITEVDDNNIQGDAVQTEEVTDNIVKDECLDSVYENKEKEIVQENMVENVAEQNLEDSTEIMEGDLVIEELPPEHVEENHEVPQETSTSEDRQENVIYEVSNLKDEVVEQQSTEVPQPTIQETGNKESELTETLIIETINDSDQSAPEHFTIIDDGGSVEFSTNSIIEVQGDQSFSEDLNSTVEESFSQDDDDEVPHDSGVTEEVIFLQESIDDNPDDPQPQQDEKPVAAQEPAPSASTKPKPRKGRKATFDIPMHVLGHDINKPVEPVVNGRAIPKPRLGVKVPYRNLTSQIVSKAEIEKEIMERGRLKMEQNKGDLKFARSLTQRLAKKIAPSTGKEDKTDSVVAEEKVESRPVAVSTMEQTSIQNDSDLLAILEGDDDEHEMLVVQKEAATSPQVDESNLKALEREIALQQLSELPHQAPKQRVFRGKTSKPMSSTPVGNTLKEKTSLPTAIQQNISKEKNKENTTAVSSPKKEYVDVSPKKQPVEIEPQVKVNMVLKTYSRKRKISEPQDPLKDYPPPKKPVYDSPDDSDGKMDVVEPVAAVRPASPVYITKSSRVIKKKVIWDPDDEMPARSPKPAPKTTSTTDAKSQAAKSSPSVKTAKIDKNSNTEKIVAEKKTPDKRVEKTPSEKKVEKTPADKKVEKTPTEKKAEKTPVEKKIEKTTPAKKSVSPKTSSGPKPKKARSEIDRLLMDEGAVKMLYELNNTDESIPKKKKDFYSVERAQKDLIKKANLLKNELEQTSSNDSQISLRKKEAIIAAAAVTPSPTRAGPVLERKMSTTSLKSLGLTPPGSPFQHTPQSSMLIRRRSSSSLSSSDDTEIEFKTRDTRRKTDTPKKKSKKSEKDKSEVDESGGSTSSKSSQIPAMKKQPQIKLAVLEVKLNQYKSFTVKKTGKHVSVDLNYIDEKCYLTEEVLKELTSILKKFSKDKECNILTITSNSKAFCLGLNYSSLVEEDEDKREELATELSEKVKDFLLCLLHFPKVLVACIQGECAGLGVTMLPLFDIVIASDSATFSAPYASLGCIGEAGFLLSYPNLVSHLLAAELLYTGQKLTADEAHRRGLISKLCWPEKYKETMKSLVVSVANASKQSLEATKKQLRTCKTKDIEAAINSEKKIWIEHWTSDECQEKFSELAN